MKEDDYIAFDEYKPYYKELERNEKAILEVLANEKNKFNKTLEKGLREFEKLTRNLTNINKKYGKYVNISFLFDKWNYLDYKDSPIDKGKNVFLELFKRRIFI